jgi:DNA-binding LacI/PurR family transcriptional regulator
MRALGAHAARLLDIRIRGDAEVPRHEVLPTQLVIRDSCGRHQPAHEDKRQAPGGRSPLGD